MFCKGERNGDFSPQNCEKKVYEFYEQMHYYLFNGIGMLNERNLVMCDGEAVRGSRGDGGFGGRRPTFGTSWVCNSTPLFRVAISSSRKGDNSTCS